MPSTYSHAANKLHAGHCSWAKAPHLALQLSESPYATFTGKTSVAVLLVGSPLGAQRLQWRR